MSQGFNVEGGTENLDVFFRGATQPGTDEFAVRLGNALLLRMKDITSSFVVGEDVTGQSSGDTGTIEAKQSNGDGTTTLKLSGITETDTFTIGEQVDGTYGSGDIDNANMTVRAFANAKFALNEQIQGQSSGATADITGVYGKVLAVNNISGSFTSDETVIGQETNAQATLIRHYAGIPGLFDDDGVSNIVAEPSGNGYPAGGISLSANTTDFPTLTTDLSGDPKVESKEVTFTASGGDIGPINTAILTVDIGGTGEKVVGASPLSDTPPSEVISDGSSLTVKAGITHG